MAAPKPKRRPAVDPAVADLLNGMNKASEERSLPTKDRRRKAAEREKVARRNRITLDIDQFLIDWLSEYANELGCPISQVVAAALIVGLPKIKGIDWTECRTRSRSPRYEWNLDLAKLEKLYPRDTP